MSQATFRFPRVNPQEQVRVTSDSPGNTLVARLRADLRGQLENLVGPNGVTTLYLQSETGTTTVSGTVPGDGAALDAAVAAVVAGAPAALDTLDELAAALGDDSNYAATITTALGKRLVTVSHAGTAGAARPTSTLPVLWIGTVAPTNAVARDLWLDESGPALKRTADGSAWVSAGGTTVAPPVPSLVGDDLVLTIPEGSVWGIDGDGLPYYDPDGAASGEEAMLVVGIDGTPAVVTIGA